MKLEINAESDGNIQHFGQHLWREKQATLQTDGLASEPEKVRKKHAKVTKELQVKRRMIWN